MASTEEAMLHPIPAFLGAASRLHRITRIPPLHHDPLKERGVEGVIGFTEPLVEREKCVVRARRDAGGKESRGRSSPVWIPLERYVSKDRGLALAP